MAFDKFADTLSLSLRIVRLAVLSTVLTIPIARSAHATDLDPHVLKLAERAHARAKARGEVKGDLITVIDYSKSSREKRFFVVDLRTKQLLFSELVSHGKNSGFDRPSSFSNELGSLKTSLGLFVTSVTYDGKHGYSLKLRGLERGWNDRAEERAIVIHGAEYVNLDFAKKHQRLGRSWGCPALSVDVAAKVIDVIKNGTAVFAYYPDEKLLTESPYLR
jgi:hypothetical protein